VRKVAGGEASAVPHTTFVGHSARQSATNPMILKQGMDDAPPEAEGPEGPLEGSELERAMLKDLTKCLNRCYDLTDELLRQGFDSGRILDGKISQLQGEVRELMEGGGEDEDPSTDLHDMTGGPI